MRKATVRIMALGLALSQHSALAQSIEGADPLICAVMRAVELLPFQLLWNSLKSRLSLTPC